MNRKLTLLLPLALMAACSQTPAPAGTGGDDVAPAAAKAADQQTLAHERFEVVVVDDGSPEPIVVPAGRFRMHVTLLRQANAGPGAARNRGATACRAPWTLILNDDAMPAPDLLARHLARVATLPPKTALPPLTQAVPAISRCAQL